jgi:hypothetical protein
MTLSLYIPIEISLDNVDVPFLSGWYNMVIPAMTKPSPHVQFVEHTEFPALSPPSESKHGSEEVTRKFQCSPPGAIVTIFPKYETDEPSRLSLLVLS